ncbi:MAG: O-antigen ligase family protein [Xanthomonadales bacterium]|jgi:TPR repeat protein/O-antigen ligase|nr:O-antigen ligase family protein [Xanthomonadales bacterium]
MTLPRSRKISRLLFVGYLLGLLYLPLQYGGNRDFAWGLALAWFCLVGAASQLAVGLRWIDPPGLWYRTRWWRRGLWLWFAFGVLQWIPLPIERSFPELPPITPYAPSSWNTLSVDAYASFRSSLKTLLYLQIALLGLLLLSSWLRIKVLLWSLVTLATVQAAAGTVVAIQDMGFRNAWFNFSSLGVSGTYLSKSHFAGYLELSIGFALALIIADLRDAPARRDWKQWLRDLLQLLLARKTQLRIATLIMVVALVMTASRGGNAALLFSLGVLSVLALFLVRRPPRSLWLLLVSLVVIDVLIISGWFGLDRLAERFAQTDVRVEFREAPPAGELPAPEDGATLSGLPAAEADAEATDPSARSPLRFASITESDRIEAARATGQMWKSAPLVGMGGGAWRSTFPAFRTAATSSSFFDHAHHDPLQLFAEYGLLGGLLAVMLVVAPLALALRAFRARRDRRMIGLAFGAALGVMSLLLHGLVDFNLQIPGNAALFTLALTLCLIAHYGRFGGRSRAASSGNRAAAGLAVTSLLLLSGSALAQSPGAETCPRAAASYVRLGLDRDRASAELARLPVGAAGAEQRAELLVRVLNEAARADALDDAAGAESLREFAKARLAREGWRATQRGERAEVAFALGELRRLGLTNVPADAVSACRAYTLAAQRGSADGLYREALCATQNDRDRALATMERAAAAGHPLAQEALGTLCLQSEPPRVECAAHWFCRAANQGLTRAAVLAAWLLSEERSPVRDVTRALELYEQAARAGDASAQNNLAEIYERGWAGIVDMPRALELYQASSRQGLPQAQLNLARLLFKTSEPGSERRREALRWLAEARPKLPKEAQSVEAEFGLLGR